MAFHCTANRPERFGDPVTQAGGRFIAVPQVGFDPAIPATFYSLIQIYPVNDEFEFAFSLTWVFNATGSDGNTFESEKVRQIIPADCRARIREMLLHYAEKVIAAAAPETFFMETFTADLPEKALAKYDALNDVFRAMGYAVVSAATSPGKFRWNLSRER